MVGKPHPIPVTLMPEERGMLEQTSRARKEPIRRVQRASILLRLADGRTIPETAKELGLNRQMVRDIPRLREKSRFSGCGSSVGRFIVWS